MAWPKPSPELIALLDEAMPPLPAERRTMFGCPAYFVNGNMFTGVFADSLFVRLPEEARARAAADWGSDAVFEPTPGRPMREYVVLPATIVHDRAAITQWLARSHSYASTIAAKPAKPRRNRKPA